MSFNYSFSVYDDRVGTELHQKGWEKVCSKQICIVAAQLLLKFIIVVVMRNIVIT